MNAPKLIYGAMRKAALAASFVAAFASGPILSATQLPSIPATQTWGRWREASLDDYRKHLMTLTTLVEACAKA